MKYFGKVSKYHVRVLVLYACFVPALFIFFGNDLHYGFERSFLASIVTVSSMLAFLVFLYPRIQRTGAVSLRLFLISFFYGSMFAIPEEIIFRGIVQRVLESHMESIPAAVIVSAVIFGLAHVYNGATGYAPRHWNWKLAGLTFLAGLPLGLLYALTHSLLTPTVLHAFFVFFLKITEDV